MVKNLKCISRLNIYYYPNRRYKSYITSLKAVIAGKSLIYAGLDIDRILHFIFYDKILQIYRQHWVRKFYQQSGGAWVLHIPHTHPLDTPLVRIINFQPNQGISIPVPVQAKLQLKISRWNLLRKYFNCHQIFK